MSAPEQHLFRGSLPDSPLGNNAPANAAQEIVYANISFVVGPGGLQFQFDPLTSGVMAGGDIDAFIAELVTSPPAPAKSLPVTIPVRTPLDIEVWRPCYVVFELDRRWNWHFLPDNAAVKTAISQETDYCQLVHVTRNGAGKPVNKPVTAPADSERCNIVYFSVSDPAGHKGRVDGFNLYIEFEQLSPRPLQIIIDPDIRNTGGNGFPQSHPLSFV